MNKAEQNQASESVRLQETSERAHTLAIQRFIMKWSLPESAGVELTALDAAQQETIRELVAVLKQFGRLNDSDCWCDAGPFGHSQRCEAARAAIKKAQP